MIKIAVQLLAAIVFCLTLSPALADIGPKASLHVSYSMASPSFVDEGVTLKVFVKSDEQGAPEQWKPAELAWGGDGKNGQAAFTYMLPQRLRIGVTVPSSDNKLYMTHPFERAGFTSRVELELMDDGTAKILSNTELDIRLDRPGYGLIVLIVTIALELFAAMLLISRSSSFPKWGRLRLGIIVVAMNILTLPSLWLLSPRVSAALKLHEPTSTLLGLLVVTVFEAIILAKANKKVSWSSLRWMMYSIAINLFSAIVGGISLLVFLGI